MFIITVMKTYFKGPGDSEITAKVSCPVCETSEVKPFWELGSYSFQKCLCCGHVYQNPRPRPDDLIRRYDEDYQVYEVENADNFFNLMQLGLEDVGFSQLEAALPQDKRFLDVGCATGKLVAHLKSRGWEALGTEVCAASAEYGRTRRGVTILEGTLEELGLVDDPFDLVHSSHVIEHVPGPGVYLDEIFRIIKPGGHFICVTPNTASFQARFYRREWRSAIADHVHLFSLTNLKRLMVRHGFTVLRQGTWGGIPQGQAPSPVKKIMDRAAKHFGFGDVMILLVQKPV